MSAETVSADLRPSLRGQLAVVTGGGRGLGRLIAIALSQHGDQVGLIARTRAEVGAVADSITRAGGVAVAATADVTDGSALRGAFDFIETELGPTGILVNNAGVNGPVAESWSARSDEWWHAVEVNLRGPVLACTCVVPAMIERGRGCVVNVTSNAGVLR